MTTQSKIRVLIAYLGLSQSLERWGIVCLILAGIGLSTSPTSLIQNLGFGLSVLASLGHSYFALRVKFDQKIFKNWIHHTAAADLTKEMQEFDQSLRDLKLIAPHPQKERTLDSRASGAIRLLRYQQYSFIVQSLCLIVAYATFFLVK